MHKIKKKVYESLEGLTIVTPSNWLADCARKSSLFRNTRIEVIANGIDLNIFKPVSKIIAKEILNLQSDRKLILFGAIGAFSDRRKGYHLLNDALRVLRGRVDNAEIMVFGAHKPVNPPDYGFRTHYAGLLHDSVSLAIHYAAADVMVVPSLQENLPYTVMEPLSCGTPVVAFDVGGNSDLLEHRRNGYLAKQNDPCDLAKGIEWVLTCNAEKYSELSGEARKKNENEFSLDLHANRYIKLFEDVLSRRHA